MGGEGACNNDVESWSIVLTRDVPESCNQHYHQGQGKWGLGGARGNTREVSKRETEVRELGMPISGDSPIGCIPL